MNTWADYIKTLLPPLMNEIMSKKKTYTKITFGNYKGDNKTEVIAFFDLLSINNKAINENSFDDFKFFRQYPLYRDTDKTDPTYIVLNSLFFTEKIYRGLYFEFSDLNDSLEEKDKIKDIRSTLTDQFSEREHLYTLLNNIFIGREYIKNMGTDYKVNSPKIKSEPDYYVRNQNSCILFESKDNLFNAKIKISYDHNLIKEYLEKRFNKDAGIPQLLNNIQRILKKELPLDDSLDNNIVEIYPCLVVHDKIYSNTGLNSILNDWFRKRLQQNSDFTQNQIRRIKNLVVIDIDTLVLLNITKITEKIALLELIKLYLDKVQNPQKIDDEIFSFRHFCFDYVQKNINADIYLKHIPSYLAKELNIK